MAQFLHTAELMNVGHFVSLCTAKYFAIKSFRHNMHNRPFRGTPEQKWKKYKIGKPLYINILYIIIYYYTTTLPFSTTNCAFLFSHLSPLPKTLSQQKFVLLEREEECEGKPLATQRLY